MEAGRYRPEDLKTFCREVFARLGMEDEDAGVVADSLVRANLEGNDSHGLSRMGIYTARMREGRISARPAVEIEHDGSVLCVDGGNGLGQVASYHALKAVFPGERRYATCQEKAKEGISLPSAVQEELEGLGREYEVSFLGPKTV